MGGIIVILVFLAIIGYGIYTLIYLEKWTDKNKGKWNQWDDF